MDQHTDTPHDPTRYSPEGKAERFRELAEQRSNRVLKGIALIGNLANKANYLFTEGETDLIVGTLREAVDDIENQFKVALNGKKPRQLRLFG